MSLGPIAAPAVPQLKRIVDTGSQQQAVCALNVIAAVGEPGLPTLISTASSTNESLRLQAIMLLEPYTNRPAALCVLTNALHDPNPSVQATAAGVLDGRLFE